MVAPENSFENLLQIIDSHFEWLIVDEDGKSFSLQKPEIEITRENGRTLLGFPYRRGFHKWRLHDASFEDGELNLKVSKPLDNSEIKFRFVPRTSAAELARNVELARLIRANEIAEIICDSQAGAKLIRVGLNTENGRLAQILLETRPNVQKAVVSDVTNICTPETILTTAFLWLEKINDRRKVPINELWIAGEKKQARNLRKLHALLNAGAKNRVKIFEITRNKNKPETTQLREHKFSDLWREKPKRLVLPIEIQPSETAEKIIALAPNEIDVINSKQGETIRFLGLPFARVRTMLGREKAWFGIERNRRLLTEENWNELVVLVNELAMFRSADPKNKRHEFFRISPESWLESILRRNIKLLDANLILSPIYNQFRASADKIDLLALRRDGRLVIIELKTSPDREMIFQAADYWRKIELQRRKGELKKARVFGDLKILDKPALVYTVAPALSFHRDNEFFARKLSPEIEIWRFELHEHWRSEIKVIARTNYADSGFTNL